MNTPLRPTIALILHSRDGNNGFGNSVAHDAVLSLHPITFDTNKSPVLDAGRLLTPAEAEVLAQRLQGKVETENETTFLPPTLLLHGATSLTWYRPPARARQFWRLPEGRITIDAILPGLLFHVQEGVLAVAAYEGTDRPTEHTPLYHAPLGNVYADTLVCVGNAHLPTHWEPSTSKHWESVLLDTNSTHTNHPNVLAGTASTDALIAFWKKREKYKSPPSARFLSPLKINAGAWVRRLAKFDR